MGGTIPGQVGLGCIRKRPEQGVVVFNLSTGRQTRPAWHLLRVCDFELFRAITDAEVIWPAWASVSPSV